MLQAEKSYIFYQLEHDFSLTSLLSWNSLQSQQYFFFAQLDQIALYFQKEQLTLESFLHKCIEDSLEVTYLRLDLAGKGKRLRRMKVNAWICLAIEYSLKCKIDHQKKQQIILAKKKVEIDQERQFDCSEIIECLNDNDSHFDVTNLKKQLDEQQGACQKESEQDKTNNKNDEDDNDLDTHNNNNQQIKTNSNCENKKENLDDESEEDDDEIFSHSEESVLQNFQNIISGVYEKQLILWSTKDFQNIVEKSDKFSKISSIFELLEIDGLTLFVLLPKLIHNNQLEISKEMKNLLKRFIDLMQVIRKSFLASILKKKQIRFFHESSSIEIEAEGHSHNLNHVENSHNITTGQTLLEFSMAKLTPESFSQQFYNSAILESIPKVVEKNYHSLSQFAFQNSLSSSNVLLGNSQNLQSKTQENLHQSGVPSNQGISQELSTNSDQKPTLGTSVHFEKPKEVQNNIQYLIPQDKTINQKAKSLKLSNDQAPANYLYISDSQPRSFKKQQTQASVQEEEEESLDILNLDERESVQLIKNERRGRKLLSNLSKTLSIHNASNCDSPNSRLEDSLNGSKDTNYFDPMVTSEKLTPVFPQSKLSHCISMNSGKNSAHQGKQKKKVTLKIAKNDSNSEKRQVSCECKKETIKELEKEESNSFKSTFKEGDFKADFQANYAEGVLNANFNANFQDKVFHAKISANFKTDSDFNLTFQSDPKPPLSHTLPTVSIQMKTSNLLGTSSHLESSKEDSSFKDSTNNNALNFHRNSLPLPPLQVFFEQQQQGRRYSEQIFQNDETNQQNFVDYYSRYYHLQNGNGQQQQQMQKFNQDEKLQVGQDQGYKQQLIDLPFVQQQNSQIHQQPIQPQQQNVEMPFIQQNNSTQNQGTSFYGFNLPQINVSSPHQQPQGSSFCFQFPQQNEETQYHQSHNPSPFIITPQMTQNSSNYFSHQNPQNNNQLFMQTNQQQNNFAFNFSFPSPPISNQQLPSQSPQKCSNNSTAQAQGNSIAIQLPAIIQQNSLQPPSQIFPSSSQSSAINQNQGNSIWMQQQQQQQIGNSISLLQQPQPIVLPQSNPQPQMGNSIYVQQQGHSINLQLQNNQLNFQQQFLPSVHVVAPEFQQIYFNQQAQYAPQMQGQSIPQYQQQQLNQFTSNQGSFSSVQAGNQNTNMKGNSYYNPVNYSYNNYPAEYYQQSPQQFYNQPQEQIMPLTLPDIFLKNAIKTCQDIPTLNNKINVGEVVAPQKSKQKLKQQQNLKCTYELPFDPFSFEIIPTVKIEIKAKNTDQNCTFRTFHSEGATIGRSTDNCIIFSDDQSISSYHAIIFYSKGEFFLQDIKSKSGTFFKVKSLPLVQDLKLKLGEVEVKITKVDKGVISYATTSSNASKGSIDLNKVKSAKIGRCKLRSDIILSDPSSTVSYVHAHFHLDEHNQPVISDLESGNGTWFRLSERGCKSQPQKLTLQDEIMISNSKKIIIAEMS